MAYNPQNVYKLRELLISPNKQTTYLTALGDAALTHRPRIDPGAFMQLGMEFASDAEMANKGHGFPTMRWETGRSTALSSSFAVTDFLAGWLAAFAMGKVATVGAGPYTHTFTFDPALGAFPVTTVYMRDTADIAAKYPDMAISELEFRGSDSGLVEGQFSMIGSGKHVDANIAGLPAVPTPTFLRGVDAQFLIGASGAAQATDSIRLKNWSVRLSAGISVRRGAGAGLYGAACMYGRPRQSFSATIAATDIDDIRTLRINQTVREVQININSGAAAQLKFKFPAIYVSGAQCGRDGDEVVWQIESDDTAVIKSGANEPVEVTVINGQANYLVAA